MGILSDNSDFVRVVHLRHYEFERNRFYNFVFKRTSKQEDPEQGVSLVSVKCVRDTHRPLCEHLRYYPPNVVSEPPVFLPIAKEELPDCDLKHQPTEFDECHYNLVGWSNGRCTKFLETFWDKPEKLVICLNGERHLTLQDIYDFRDGKLTVEDSNPNKSPSFYQKYLKPIWEKTFPSKPT